MKTLLCFLLSAFCVSAFAQGAAHNIHPRKGATNSLAVPVCALAATVGTVDDNISDFNTATYLAVSFVATNTGQVCKISDELWRDADISGQPGTLQAAIYTDSAGSPGTLVGSASATVDRTAVVHLAYNDFVSVAASITSSTTYWVVLITDSALGTSHLAWVRDDTAETSTLKSSTDGSSWTLITANATFRYKLYTQ